ncbi:MAG: HDIG domain-containing protein, partial [Planctomycetota bacterium]
YNPLWRYDKAATAQAIDEAVKRVPDYTIPYEVGDLLVRRGTVLLDAEIKLLKREHEEYLKAEKDNPRFFTEWRLKQFGVAIVVLLLTMGLVTYIASYQDRVFQKPARAFGLAALMALMIGLSRLIGWIDYPSKIPPGSTVFLVVIAAALLTIAYDQRFAFGIGGTLAILITLASDSNFGLFLTLMVAMGVTVFSLKEIRSRSKIIVVGMLAAVGAMITSFVSDLIAGQELFYVCVNAMVAAVAAVAAGFIVQGILPNFEKLFGVATSMTLLEWCDAGRPLLRRLAQEAPGTYSHSLIIGQMCEEACESIGSRGLLGRVGALYHDVGKMQKSAYFVENQEARMSRHDQLSPTMSLLIIIGHVKDGIEMARAYGLPRILHQFIAEHHGTTVVKYFHHAASEAAAKNSKTKGKHDREVPESEFRYPGPKPRSKESAILMLCDTCEGAVRALTEPTPGRVESTVHNMVMDRLNDGQFDDCDITLRELKIVEQSMVKSLCAIHHGRIKYPKGDVESVEAKLPQGSSESKQADVDRESSADSTDETPEVARQA